jgi:acyl-CoA thioesterase II
MGTLMQATNLLATNDGFSVVLDPDWEGWGPAGGYLAAIALRAAEHVAREGHRPITLSAQFLSKPERGKADVLIDVCKPGVSSLVNVSLSQSKRRFFQAQIWTTSKTTGPHNNRIAMPKTPPPEALSTLEEHFSELGRSLVTFWSRLDCRPIEFRAPGGALPQTDRLQRWYRFRDEAESVNSFEQAARAAILIDANIWAAHWRMLESEPEYGGPSLDLTVWFHDVTACSEWLLLDSTSPTAQCGVIHGTGSVWSADGRLIASGGGNCLVVPFVA